MKLALPVLSFLGLVPGLGLAQAPLLTGTVPTAHTLNGPRTGPVGFSFSQSVADPTAIKVNSNMRQGRRTGAFSGAGTGQVQFQPVQPFAPGERVSLTVPATVSSVAKVVEFRAASTRGTATFSPPATIAPGPNASPSAVVAGDVDADGDLDLLVGEYQSNGVTVCLNDGSGQFTAQPGRLTTANRATQLQLADFNGDGILDLLSSNRTGVSNLEVALNLGRGQGGFQARMLLLSPGFTPSVVTGDFNADGLVDVVVGTPGGSGLLLQMLPGRSTGTPAVATTSPATIAARDLGAADMDGDGDLDLLLLSDAVLGVYLNNGGGQFTAGAVLGVNPFSGNMTVGDFTGDGFADVVCSSAQSANLSLVPGNGAGGLLPVRNVPALSRTGTLNSGDMDGDFDLDLLVTNDRGITQVLLNNGTGQFSPASAVLIGYEPFAMANAADLNGDGLLDVYTGHQVTGPDMHGIDFFFNLAPTVSSTRLKGELAVSLSPNPAQGQAQLQLPANTGPVTVEVLDLLSRVVLTVPTGAAAAGGAVTLPLAGLTPGLYLVRVHSATGRSLTRLEVK